MENIMDFMSAALHGDALSRLSSQMNESPGVTRRGLESAVPAAFAALASYGSSSGKAEELVGAIRSGNYPHADLDQISNTLDPNATARIAQSSTGFLNRIFGNRLDGTIDALAGTSGMGRSSASTLLGVAAPLVMGFVGKQVTSENLDARGFGGWLAEQGRKAVSLLPGPLATALGATTAFGGDTRAAVGDSVHRVRPAGADVAHGTYARTEHRAASRGSLWWILGALAITLFAWQMLRSSRTPNRTNTEAPRAVQEAPQAPAIVPRAAPDQMAAAAASGASALHAVLTGDTELPATIPLDQLHFASGSSALLNKETLDDVATVLKTHEGARVRLDGFADTTGNAAMNEQLAQSRAQSVKDYLVAGGVPADRIEAVGRATDRPVANNDSASGRADNRRVEMTVLAR
jgi:outer membrane protein OmpA-like peptidoglycan-associated protein